MLAHFLTTLIRFRLIHLFGLGLLLNGCASNGRLKELTKDEFSQNVIAYQQTLTPDHPDLPSQLFQIDPQIKQLIRTRFDRARKHQRARDLAIWLVDNDGHAMDYDVDANLRPNEAFYQRKGNCLTFTMLLVSLAKELDVDLKFNDVDLPNSWQLDERTGLVFYRHVNAILRSVQQDQVFDLAIDEYDSAYPQRTISVPAAGALFHSNVGIDALKAADFDLAFHHLRLSVSLDPKNPDLWVNLGAAYKRNQQFQRAEHAFKIAFETNDRNSLAASNLERLYRLQGRTRLAQKFEKLARRARLKNPYVQYRLAKQQYQESDYKTARKSIKRAIRLHNQDPSFYALSSAINLQTKRYKPALLDLEKAYNVSKGAEEKGRYFSKVKRVVKHVESEVLKQQQGNYIEPKNIYILDDLRR